LISGVGVKMVTFGVDRVGGVDRDGGVDRVGRVGGGTGFGSFILIIK